MKIVIPMSGFGERFRRAGYSVPKPLIPVEGKPIIAHVIDMFPGEQDFLFICNQEHLEQTSMRSVLQQWCPTGQIVGIAPHKLGPVYAVSQAFDYLDDDQPTLINYCDFTCYWNYEHFKQWLHQSRCDGCVPAYRGFHPHSLGSTNYAFIQETQGWLTAIQEKQPFTDNKMAEFASSGTYYFASGRLVKQFFQETLARDIQVNGEFYCSVVYNLLVEAGLRVSVYELQHFMQWGTPEDLSEYCRWSNAFRDLSQPDSKPRPPLPGTTLISMAGQGKRFQTAGYPTPKPLIPVSGRPMVVQATQSLPPLDQTLFVCQQDHLLQSDLPQTLESSFPGSRLLPLNQLTDGQARTCLLALPHLNTQAPLTISACDHGVLFDADAFEMLFRDPEIDCIVWVTRGHPEAMRHPQMYGWVKIAGTTITGVSVKQPLQDPSQDPMIIGTFTFRQASLFQAAAERMLERQAQVNQEYYVDTCIEDALALGYRCVIFDVNHYLGWGTPNDLKTFEYWQSCFHKWAGHPYRCERDRWFSPEALSAMQPTLAPVLPPDIPAP